MEWDEIIYHHGLSILGIGYQLANAVGGGLMVRFLLDSMTLYLYMLEYLLKGKEFLWALPVIINRNRIDGL